MTDTTNTNTMNTTINTAGSDDIGVKPHLLFEPERRVLDAADAQKMAVRCTEYNDSRNEKRNFKCVEFNGVKFKNEDFAGIEAHYGKFVNCEFEACKIRSAEFHFAEFENCLFKNCELANSNFSFSSLVCVSFFNCNLDGVDMPFAKGNFSCNNCMMNGFTAQNSHLLLLLSNSNAYRFEANASCLDLEVHGCNFRHAEFNNSTLKGKIEQTDLTGGEMNQADLSELELIDSATRHLETEDAVGFDELIEDFESLMDEK